MAKRLVIDVTEAEHAGLTKQARRAGQTVSNYVRWHIGLEARQQGVKHKEASNWRTRRAKKAAAASAKARAKKARAK